MKIGLINYHCAHNYGAMLQAVALQNVIKKEGFDVKIIDFEPEIIMGGYKIWNIDMLINPKKFLWLLINYKRLKSKYKIFEDFKNNNMILTSKYTNKINLDNEKFDVIVTGSDQVWNMDLNGGLTEYLLSFIPINTGIKRVAYAASIGSDRISRKNMNLMCKELNLFNKISVREDDAVKIIKNEFNLSATQVLDPVFLLEKEEWDIISKVSHSYKEKYVLIYGLEENDLFEKTLKFIKENTQFKIINVSPSKDISEYIDTSLNNIGPAEFLGVLKNAEIVITNSFHGTCFSIIYGKKFCTIKHSELNSRINSILRVTGLEGNMIERDIKDVEDFNAIIDYDKNKVNEILKEEIIKSKKFLFDALS